MFVARLALLLPACLLSCAVADDFEPPNVVFVMVDDMGWADLGSYGQKVVPTPELNVVRQNECELPAVRPAVRRRGGDHAELCTGVCACFPREYDA